MKRIILLMCMVSLSVSCTVIKSPDLSKPTYTLDS